MKYLVRVVVALGIVVPPAAAQAQVSVGVRVGVNISDRTVDTTPELPSLEGKKGSGFVGGGFVTLPVTSVFAFQPEVLFSRQGSQYLFGDFTQRTTLDYVQVPLLARVRLGMQSPLAVVVGPSLGFLTNATAATSATDFDRTFDVEGNYKRHDIGIVTGAAFTAAHLVFDARYTWGLTNIVKDPDPGTIQEITYRVKNRVLSFSAGLRF